MSTAVLDRLPRSRSAWAAVYGTQASAAWLVVRGDAAHGEYDVPAFVAFSSSVGLSAVWLLAFVGLRRPAVSLLAACALWVAVAVTAREFLRRHRVAAALLAPSLLWVSLLAAASARSVLSDRAG